MLAELWLVCLEKAVSRTLKTNPLPLSLDPPSQPLQLLHGLKGEGKEVIQPQGVAGALLTESGC